MSEQVEAPQTNIIDINHFAAVELRIGTIMECVEVEKSDRLLRMQVDFGVLGKRQILSGVKKYFKPEDLIGKQATFVVNFAPRAMMGFQLSWHDAYCARCSWFSITHSFISSRKWKWNSIRNFCMKNIIAFLFFILFVCFVGIC